MTPKAKKCKGTGKAKGHGCGNTANVRIYGLGKFCCYTTWLISTPEGKEVLNKAKIRASKKVQQEKRREWRIKKDQYVDYGARLQTEINSIAKLIDKGVPCLARGNHPNVIQAGHVYSRGSTPSAKYNLHNIHNQGARSNGSQVEDLKMWEGLNRVYGFDYQQFVATFKQIQALKLSHVELKELTSKARKIKQEIQRQGKTFDALERIEMRNKINVQLGIYTEQFAIYGRKNK